MKKGVKKVAKPGRGGKRPGSGRPKSDNPRSETLGWVRITTAEKEAIMARAEADGESASEWVRRRLEL